MFSVHSVVKAFDKPTQLSTLKRTKPHARAIALENLGTQNLAFRSRIRNSARIHANHSEKIRAGWRRLADKNPNAITLGWG